MINNTTTNNNDGKEKSSTKYKKQRLIIITVVRVVNTYNNNNNQFFFLQHYIINWYDMLYHRANKRRRIKSLLLINTTRQYWLGPAWTYNWLPSYASKSTFIYPKFTHFISTAQHCAMWGHVGRVVKALDSKSIGLCPRRFKSCTWRKP